MLGTIATEAILILLMLIANGVFAMSEMAVVSARRARLQQLAQTGDAGAAAALKLSEAPNRFLSTVQIGITLIGILAGAFGGATLAEELGGLLQTVPLIGSYSEAAGVIIVVLLTTYFSLIIGELVPKRLALRDPERIAALIARPMRALSRLAGPAVWLLTVSSDLLLRLFGSTAEKGPSISEQEVNLLIEQGIQEGIFEEAEQEIIERVFRLDTRRVSTLMTPRRDVVWLDIHDPLDEIQRKTISSGFTYFPVARDFLDNTLGIISVKSLWAEESSGKFIELNSMLRPALYIPETASALGLLRLFQESQQHLALVVNEHGGVEGIVTLIDVLEAMVGDIPDLGEQPEEEPIVRRDDASWLVDGMLAIDEFKESFDIDALPMEGQGGFQTVGGFVMSYLERIPSVSDQFDSNGYRFEVVDMDGYRVDKIMVTRL